MHDAVSPSEMALGMGRAVLSWRAACEQHLARSRVKLVWSFWREDDPPGTARSARSPEGGHQWDERHYCARSRASGKGLEPMVAA